VAASTVVGVFAVLPLSGLSRTGQAMDMRKILAVLLTLNLGMLAYLAFRRSQPGPLPAELPTAQSSPPLTVAVPEPQVVTNVVTNRFEWRQLESEDYRTYILRLRSIGCPEQTIRDIIIADLDNLFAPRLAAIYPRKKELKYWESEEEELANEHDQRAWQKQEASIDREKREVVRDLMGVDLVAERLKLKGQEDYFARRLPFLSEDKRMQVRDIIEKFNELDWDIRQKQWDEGEPLSAQDRATLRASREAREAELNRLLAPPEREQFDLWMSDAAAYARFAMYGMGASEEEFRKVYQLRAEFEKQWPRDEFDLEDPQVRTAWEQAGRDLDEKLKAALGPDRFAQLERGRDHDFHEMNALAARYKFPKQRAVEVYEVKAALLEARQRVRSDAVLNGNQKDSALDAMDEETSRMLRAVLGEKAFNYYRRKADWLRWRSG
jgi:hypothetical protein